MDTAAKTDGRAVLWNKGKNCPLGVSESRSWLAKICCRGTLS
jgi:hypothetical protein